MLAFVVFLVALALLFDFLNGMNDAANSIATVISTRVLSPRLAVLWAAFFNFVAAFVFGVHVANTIGKGIVDPAGHLSSHAARHPCRRHRLDLAVHPLWACRSASRTPWSAPWWGPASPRAVSARCSCPVCSEIALFIALAPLIGFGLGALLMVAVLWICRRSAPGPVDRWFRRLQLLSAALFSLGHGANDAQKTMGIIAVLLYSTGYLGDTFYVPVWVIFACYARDLSRHPRRRLEGDRDPGHEDDQAAPG